MPRRAVGELDSGHHACALFRTDSEHYDLLAQFVAAGLCGNERVSYSTDDQSPQEVLNELAKRGIDVERYTKSSRLDVATARQSYLAGGLFDPDTVIDGWIKTANRAMAQGLKGVRIASNMGWVIRNVPGFTRFGEYERRVQTELFPHYPIIGMCEFDLRRFSPSWLTIIEQLHPHGHVAL